MLISEEKQTKLLVSFELHPGDSDFGFKGLDSLTAVADFMEGGGRKRLTWVLI